LAPCPGGSTCGPAMPTGRCGSRWRSLTGRRQLSRHACSASAGSRSSPRSSSSPGGPAMAPTGACRRPFSAGGRACAASLSCSQSAAGRCCGAQPCSWRTCSSSGSSSMQSLPAWQPARRRMVLPWRRCYSGRGASRLTTATKRPS
jgi:hypothetical protein